MRRPEAGIWRRLLVRRNMIRLGNWPEQQPISSVGLTKILKGVGVGLLERNGITPTGLQRNPIILMVNTSVRLRI